MSHLWQDGHFNIIAETAQASIFQAKHPRHKKHPSTLLILPMSSTDTSPKSLSVAIIGGGIGGLCAAIALLKHPQIDVQVYEAAPTFGEIGAGVGIGPNAQQALELIGPEARAAYDKHATGNMWPKHAKTIANYIVVSPFVFPYKIGTKPSTLSTGRR